MPPAAPDPSDPFFLVREVRRLGVEVARARGRGEARPGQEARLAELRARLLAPGRPRAPWRVAWGAVLAFPGHVHALRRHVGLAALCFWAAVVLGFAAVALDPLAATWLLPDAVRESVIARLADGNAWLEQVGVAGAPALSGSLLVRNVEAAMEALAFGVLAGVGAVVAMVRNGVFLGAVAGLVHAQGLDRVLWAFVAPHGVLELPAVWLAGGAGLALGEAVLLPGPRGRAASLRAAAQHAGPVGVALIPLLSAAALIEGFVSPIPKPDAVSFGIAGLLALGLGAYLATGWRSDPARTPASSTAAPAARQRSMAWRR
ncbi:MAG: stage II sporulation protein M [Pseudomonadota bacterium]